MKLVEESKHALLGEGMKFERERQAGWLLVSRWARGTRRIQNHDEPLCGQSAGCEKPQRGWRVAGVIA